MKERPILFSGPMVAAILAGRKSQTRRVVKPQPTWDTDRERWAWESRLGAATWSGDRPVACALHGMGVMCPFGRPGDRLWVRETWAIQSPYEDDTGAPMIPCYRADGEDQRRWDIRWRPSIYMPRNVSRITLEITGVRVERLQEISEEDALAEGVSYTGPYPYAVAAGFLPRPDDLARQEYRTLWESINGPGSWDANPWVWVIEFKRVAQP